MKQRRDAHDEGRNGAHTTRDDETDASTDRQSGWTGSKVPYSINENAGHTHTNRTISVDDQPTEYEMQYVTRSSRASSLSA